MNFKGWVVSLVLAFSSLGIASVGGMSCSVSGLKQSYTKTVEGSDFLVFPFSVVLDGAMHDWGKNGSGDNMEFYCVQEDMRSTLGVLAACLSKEACPWRK